MNNQYHQIAYEGGFYYYNYQTKKTQYERPPPGAKVYYTVNNENKCYIQQEVNTLNDMPGLKRSLGPAGSNLFLFHLPNDMRDS